MLIELYKNMFLKLTRGNYRGHILNAKPVFLISLIDSIPEIISNNQIYFDDVNLKLLYIHNFAAYHQGTPSAYEKPFYHMGREPFYSLEMKEHASPIRDSSPSAKYLRENLIYAKFDDELWELLQDADNREYLKQAIIDQYLQ